MDGKFFLWFSPHPPTPNAHDGKVEVYASVGIQPPMSKAKVGLNGNAKKPGRISPDAGFSSEKDGCDVEENRGYFEEEGHGNLVFQEFFYGDSAGTFEEHPAANVIG